MPRDGTVMIPREWIKATGPVKFLTYSGKAKCDDCLHLILDFVKGHEMARAPGLARIANTRRVQGGEEHLLCYEHAQARREKGEGT